MAYPNLPIASGAHSNPLPRHGRDRLEEVADTEESQAPMPRSDPGGQDDASPGLLGLELHGPLNELVEPAPAGADDDFASPAFTPFCEPKSYVWIHDRKIPVPLVWEQMCLHFEDRGIARSELSLLQDMFYRLRCNPEWQGAADLSYEDWVEPLVSALNEARLSNHPVVWPVPGRRDAYWLRWGVGLLLYLLAVTLASVELTGSLWPWSRGEPPGLA